MRRTCQSKLPSPGSLEDNPGSDRSNRLVDLEDHLATLTRQLDESRLQLEAATERAEQSESECESAEADILEAEFEQCGYRTSDCPTNNADKLDPSRVAKIRDGYAAVFDFLGQIAYLRRECEDLSHEVDELEIEVDEAQDRLDEGYSTWVGEQVRRAEALPAPPPVSNWCGLIPAELVGRLSEDARKIVGTFHKLHSLYSREVDLHSLDWGPLVGTMSKVCERILSDFLEPRCRAIFDDPALSQVFATKTNYTDGIPEADRGYRVENSALHRILDFRKKSGPLHWSGTRNAAIALLLFGQKFRVGAESGYEIDNPLKLFGTEEDRAALRCDLYRLQDLRNGFIHHDPADQEQAVGVLACFRKCVRRLCYVLFGVADSVTDSDEFESE